MGGGLFSNQRTGYGLHATSRPSIYDSVLYTDAAFVHARGRLSMYDGPNPDIGWYLRISAERHVTPRCPFASVERCPRYYQSLSLLGEAGSTKIPDEEDNRLEALWQKSDLWPITREQETSMFGGERMTTFSNFCPEIIYDRFHVFASVLCEHVDDIDRDFAYQKLHKASIPRTDWRWRWWAITPMHFTECPLYSPLTRGDGLPAETAPKTQHVREQPLSTEKPGELVSLKPGIWGMNIDLKEAGRRLRRRFERRRDDK